MYYDELLSDESSLVTSAKIEKYHLLLKHEVKKALDLSYKAREQGKDPKKEVEIYIAQDVASRTEGLVGPTGIAKRFKELEEDESIGKDEIVVQIAKEIARGKYHDGPKVREDLADQALRTALSYQTEGITAAPIEGIGQVRIKSNPDNTEYLAVYYSGPIRSAGGTAQGVSVYLADIIRKELGLAPYKATEKEVERMLEEVRLYNKIMHLQLPTSDDEIRHAWRNIPIMIHGDPTESDEVGGYRDIPSMDTNRVRGGACLVLNDGLVGRAKKITKRTDKLKLEGWEWLQEIAKGKYTDKRATESEEGGKNPTEVKPDISFASDALMGRPTFADATVHGGWRLRYGHARNTGIAAIGIHPGLMAAVNDYLAPGTHVRTERPGKGSIVCPIDTIRPPIVLLNNGNVVEIENYQLGVELKDEIKEILFMGDMLVGFGEFIQNNYRLCPVGYNEEWWYQELVKAGWKPENEEDEITTYAEIMYHPVTEDHAIKLSKEYNIPLHPKYTPAWKYLDRDEIKYLQQVIWQGDKLPLDVKDILEKMFVMHEVENNLIITKNINSLRIQLPKGKTIGDEMNGLKMVESISEVKIRDTMGTTIGARMGRPEKAKARHMSPRLHGLFPVGTEKGINKNLGKALERQKVNIYAGRRYCYACDLIQWQVYCKKCGVETEIKSICQKCRRAVTEPPCDNCGSARVNYKEGYELDLLEHTDPIRSRIGSLNEKIVQLKDKIDNPKGVIEILDKGVLRAKTDLHVFRDGTIRYDATDAPLTHFYPREIGVSVDKLIEIGYTEDIFGNALTNPDQLIEMKTQDIIIHESSIQHFKDVANFVDEELKFIYKLEPYYNIKTSEDLVGRLVIGLAPHTSAGVIGRIIGFTKSSVCWAHPFWHTSKRRNCDGDEDGIILLLDGFLNFSKEYLPTSRGSKMDTPLVLVVTLNPLEVDDEAFNLDCVSHYPLELYEAADRLDMPSEVVNLIHRAEDRLGKAEQYEGFTFSHSTSNISQGPLITRYKDSDMGIRDKLEEQLHLADIIRAVNKKETALRILERHALPDLLGNLRAFASQKVRCVTCNEKYRRVPLSGKCINPECRKSNIILTVFPKSVSKYFDVCEKLIMNYDLGRYHEDRLAKIKLALDSHFNEEEEDKFQTDLSSWM